MEVDVRVCVKRKHQHLIICLPLVLGAFVLFVFGSGLVALIYGVRALLLNLPVEYHYGVFNFFTISIILIVLGGLLIIAVVLGVFGALKDVAKVRMVALGLIFIVVLSFGKARWPWRCSSANVLLSSLVLLGSYAMFMSKTGRLHDSIKTDMEALGTKYSELTPALQKKADYVNRKFNCCTTYVPPQAYDSSSRNEELPESCKYLDAPENANLMTKVFESNCTEVYTAAKAGTVFQASVLTLASAGATFIGLVLYGIISQRRTHAGYAGVSRG